MLKKHRDNLTKLATYLESLPDDYDHFGMDEYNADEFGKVIRIENRSYDCGTVACAVGHGPAAVAHVSDAHWEAALEAASKIAGWSGWDAARDSHAKPIYIDHARCLILLGEVEAPVDPIEAAIDAAFTDLTCRGEWWGDEFTAACRYHFAGLTFPEASQ